jgi:hypothetical protein
MNSLQDGSSEGWAEDGGHCRYTSSPLAAVRDARVFFSRFRDRVNTLKPAFFRVNRSFGSRILVAQGADYVAGLFLDGGSQERKCVNGTVQYGNGAGRFVAEVAGGEHGIPTAEGSEAATAGREADRPPEGIEEPRDRLAGRHVGVSLP